MARQPNLAKLMAQVAEIAKQHDMTIDETPIMHHEFHEEQIKREKAEFATGMEVVLLSRHYAHAVTAKKCGWCHQTFMTTYCYQMFCSELCANTEFEAHFGVDPKVLKLPPSFWQYEPVPIAKPALTKALYEYAKHIVQLIESLPDTEYEELPEDSFESEPVEETIDSEPTEQPQPTPEVLTIDLVGLDDSPPATPQSEPDTLELIILETWPS